MKRLLLFAVLLSTVLLTGQDRPRASNVKLVDRPIAGTLASTMQAIIASRETAWVGYAVPVIAGNQHMCCFNYKDSKAVRVGAACCGGCSLEARDNQGVTIGDVDGCAEDASDSFFVIARVSGGVVERIRSYSTDCALDFGGKTLYWLGDAKPSDSLAWLSGFASRYDGDDEEGTSRRAAAGALTSIAFHRDPGADLALQTFIAAGKPRKLRQQAAFWLGNARGQRGFEILRDLIRNDEDSKFREEATFALSQSRVPQAQQELIRVAHQDPDHKVRGQALFWLAQKAGEKASKAITDAIENDPDTDVKKKAVFSLSQMQDNEGVPLLISVAKTNKNPVVRKEAIFWLGQSNDPRALDYIESFLK